MRTAYWLTIILALLGPQKHATQRYERFDDMATEHRWQGTTGSWLTVTNWDTGEYPSSHDATDNAIFSSLSQQSVDGVDLSGEFAIKRIITQPTYSGNIGASGSPLIVLMASVGDVLSRVIHRGSGTFHFEGAVGGFSDVLVDSRNQTDAFFASGSMGNLFVKSGFCRVLSTGSLSNFVVVDGAGAKLIIDAPDAGELAGTYLIVNAGVCENARAIDNTGIIAVLGGHLIQTGALPDGVVIVVGPNGRFTYTPNITLTAAHDDVDLATFGMLDISESHQDIGFNTYIVGSSGGVLGTPVQSGGPSALATQIDLREEYP